MDDTEQMIDDLIQENYAAPDTESSTTTTVGEGSFLNKLYLLSAERLLQGNGLAVGMLTVTATILSFFLYKIVSSLNRRDRAKEAKKKLKQQRNQKDSPKASKKKN